MSDYAEKHLHAAEESIMLFLTYLHLASIAADRTGRTTTAARISQLADAFRVPMEEISKSIKLLYNETESISTESGNSSHE